jgi:hypothetical protein
MKISIQDKNGTALTELTINESTFLTAVRKLFEEEIQKGFKRLADQTKAQARRQVRQDGAGVPVRPPLAQRVAQRVAQPPRPAQQASQQIIGVDVREWARLGLAVVGEDLPDSLRLILGAALNGGVPKP